MAKLFRTLVVALDARFFVSFLSLSFSLPHFPDELTVSLDTYTHTYTSTIMFTDTLHQIFCAGTRIPVAPRQSTRENQQLLGDKVVERTNSY